MLLEGESYLRNLAVAMDMILVVENCFSIFLLFNFFILFYKMLFHFSFNFYLNFSHNIL